MLGSLQDPASPRDHSGEAWQEARRQRGEGPEEPVLEQTVGDLSLGMLLGSACVHLASDPPLPIKIKLIFFCLPPRTQLFL